MEIQRIDVVNAKRLLDLGFVNRANMYWVGSGDSYVLMSSEELSNKNDSELYDNRIPAFDFDELLKILDIVCVRIYTGFFGNHTRVNIFYKDRKPSYEYLTTAPHISDVYIEYVNDALNNGSLLLASVNAKIEDLCI